jgi:2-keto-4-pentenoate hydratase/2-oxohepta-3-ene-1,7-dioic acid hydratase in catechol pathway
MTLTAGDVILTGTPSGVGAIRLGDRLEAQIDDWPPLQNRVANAGKDLFDRLALHPARADDAN